MQRHAAEVAEHRLGRDESPRSEAGQGIAITHEQLHELYVDGTANSQEVPPEAR